MMEDHEKVTKMLYRVDMRMVRVVLGEGLGIKAWLHNV